MAREIVVKEKLNANIYVMQIRIIAIDIVFDVFNIGALIHTNPSVGANSCLFAATKPPYCTPSLP